MGNGEEKNQKEKSEARKTKPTTGRMTNDKIKMTKGRIWDTGGLGDRGRLGMATAEPLKFAGVGTFHENSCDKSEKRNLRQMRTGETNSKNEARNKSEK